ncbi:MarR family transcriptional regulator [Actinoplanes sp. KI2]|uniref:MarR family winged helix-turn-helix transcriptional regulator n=1 Tax=Actinoplanes sp. KI2 TaxID=2983315 RepID=UPI0021D5798A|nr:MarR family transcriptional regulator [Actinoplanes sp. KI2]MCU7729845.1 MarR family transcriptional regulator [Actinoplanes sp. KI2]
MAATMDLMQLLTRAERLVAQRVTAVLAEWSVSIDAWRVITRLAEEPETMGSLSAALFMPAASLTRLIDQLVDDNLVYRRVDAVDRRRIRAHLTPRGRRLYARITADLSDMPDDSLLAERLSALITSLSGASVTGITS